MIVDLINTHREGDSEDGEESQGAALNGAGGRQRDVGAGGVSPGVLGHLGDQHRHCQTSGEQEVDDSPKPLDAPNRTRQHLHAQRHHSQHHRVQHEPQCTHAHPPIVHMT